MSTDSPYILLPFEIRNQLDEWLNDGNVAEAYITELTLH